MSKCINFNDFCELCEREAVMDGRTGAATNYRKARKKIESYLSGRTLLVGDIDGEWVKGFNAWLAGLGHEKSSASFYNRTIRSIYNQAVRKQLTKDSHPFEGVYTKSPVSHYPVRMSEDEERVSFEELSRDELLRRYKSLAYKYNNIVHRLREIMPV